MKTFVPVALSLLIVCGASGAEAAPVPAVQTASGSSANWRNVIGANQSASVGWSFSVGAWNVEVDALGIYDDGLDGMVDAHAVGLWTSGGTLLAQATVPSGTGGTLVGSYRYTSIAPITLTAGQTYVVGTYFGPVPDLCSGSACGDVLLYNGSETYATGITFLQSRQTLSVAGAGSLAFVNVDAGIAEGFFGPNFLMQALAPTVSLDPASLDFGAVTVGQPSAVHTVTIGNTGTANLVLGGLTLGGSNAAEFALSNDTCSNQTLAPGGSCTIGVSLTAAAPGPRAAQLDVPSNAATSPDHVALTAAAAAAPAAPAAGIPTLGPWGLAALSLLLAWLGWRRLGGAVA